MIFLRIVNTFHKTFVFNRRVLVLAKNICDIIPKNVRSVLDIGCGDGTISSLILKNKPNILIKGLEVSERKRCLIDCKVFSGIEIPLKNSAVDLCILIDVLHHTVNIQELLKEAIRVSQRYIIIKDHIYSNYFDLAVLRFMDWIGNKPYGVNLPYNYQKKDSWLHIFQSNNVKITMWNDNLKLYPFPFSLLFGNKLHFITLLEKKDFLP